MRAIKLDKTANECNKLARRTAKHSILVKPCQWVTGINLRWPISHPDSRAGAETSLQISGWALFLVFFFPWPTNIKRRLATRAGVFLICAPMGAFRVCCSDKDTLIVAYDPVRGEQRGPRKKGVEPLAVALGGLRGLGNICVQVCPTASISVNGLPVCNAPVRSLYRTPAMSHDKMNYPAALISYNQPSTISPGKDQVHPPASCSATAPPGGS